MTEQSPIFLSSPVELFENWMAEAKISEKEDPDAACITTVDETGMPNARMVLMRFADERGFTFFTNYNSQKGRELIAHPKAAACFHWKSLRRQIRIQGNVEKTTEAESDAYFNSRARGSRISAWASLQSSPLPDRATLEERVKHYEEEFKGIENPPRPPHWGGFRIIPQRIEFWQQTEFRLHNRAVYTKDGDKWVFELLYP